MQIPQNAVRYSSNQRGDWPGAASFASLVKAAALPNVAATYRVGVGKNSNPYLATMHAIQASGEWPDLSIAGKVVVIKPNLVLGVSPDTGTVTDPEVVRAVADKALDGGAAYVFIVETAKVGANFLPCGYSYLQGYRNKVTLVDMKMLPQGLNPIPGWVFQAFYSPTPY